MKDLLLKQQPLAVLVRPTAKQMARERVEQILQEVEAELGHRLPRPVVLTGDVCQPDLGLISKEVQWVKDYCNQVIHSAAILDFHGEDRQQDPWRTNLGGTKNVLKLSQEASIENLHYVSTAYVCGNKPSPILETEMTVPESFRNDYEQSKFEAEAEVRAATGFASKTIFRPAVIVGDSETGYTSTYHGIFLYLRLLAMLVPLQERNADGQIETQIEMPMKGDEPRNLVPIDWVSKVIAHLVLTPEGHGRTYHLSPDKGLTGHELLDYCYSYFNSTGVKFAGENTDAEAKASTDNEFAQKFFENAEIYSSYETSDPQFCKANVEKFAGHLPCPPIDKAMVERFLDFGKQDSWGKRRKKPVQVQRWIESHLNEIASAILSTFGTGFDQATFCLGLDINGPGGGQWTLTQDELGIDVSPGLPSEDSPVLKLSDTDVNELLVLEDRDQRSEMAMDWSRPLAAVMQSQE